MVTWTAEMPASAPDVVARRVDEVERQLRVTLPPAFVEIATKYPMAEPSPNTLLIQDFGTAVEHLLHFEEEDFNHILVRGFPVEDVVDEGVFPFAVDIGGDLYCFDYRGGSAVPSVAYWSVDTGLVPLADSFEAFLDMLMDGNTVRDILVARAIAASEGDKPGGA